MLQARLQVHVEVRCLLRTKANDESEVNDWDWHQDDGECDHQSMGREDEGLETAWLRPALQWFIAKGQQ